MKCKQVFTLITPNSPDNESNRDNTIISNIGLL